MHKIATIILMRKGSKRLPNKMMLKLGGKSLYKWTLDFAEQLGFPVYFCHDYDNIEVSENINVIKRTKYFAGDLHKTAEEIISLNLDVDYYILLQCTSPFRNIDAYLNRINIFIDNNFDVGFSAKKLKDGLYYSDNMAVNYNIDNRNYNGCVKKVVYKETGAFYIFKKWQLGKKHILKSENRYIIDDTIGIDIDTKEDFEKAERFLSENKSYT